MKSQDAYLLVGGRPLQDSVYKSGYCKSRDTFSLVQVMALAIITPRREPLLPSSYLSRSTLEAYGNRRSYLSLGVHRPEKEHDKLNTTIFAPDLASSVRSRPEYMRVLGASKAKITLA